MAMPTIPTAAEIKARIVADIETEIGQTSPALPKSWNGVIAGAVAGVIRTIIPCNTRFTVVDIPGNR